MSLTFGITFGDLTFGVTFGPLSAPSGPAPIAPQARGELVTNARVAASLTTYGGRTMEPFYRGESRLLTVTVLVAGIAVNILSGAYQITALEYTLKPSLDDGTPVTLTKTLASGITVLAQAGDTLGQATIAIATADTKNIPAGDYWEMVSAVFASAPGEHVYVVPPQRRMVRSVVKLPS